MCTCAPEALTGPQDQSVASGTGQQCTQHLHRPGHQQQSAGAQPAVMSPMPPPALPGVLVLPVSAAPGGCSSPASGPSSPSTPSALRSRAKLSALKGCVESEICSSSGGGGCQWDGQPWQRCHMRARRCSSVQGGCSVPGGNALQALLPVSVQHYKLHAPALRSSPGRQVHTRCPRC